MKSNDKLNADVTQALLWDSTVEHTHIRVSVDHHSTVTLDGEVPDQANKLAAAKVAAAVPGVVRVVQHLKVTKKEASV